MRIILTLLILAAMMPHAFAQAAILQSGPATPGHTTSFVTNGVVKDSGAIPITVEGNPAAGDCLGFVSATTKLVTVTWVPCGGSPVTADNWVTQSGAKWVTQSGAQWVHQ